MQPQQIYLFDDAVARTWQPFSLTRPAGELLLGMFTFRERAARRFGARCAGHVAPRHLRGFEEPGAAPVIGPEDGDRAASRILLSSRALPDWGEPAAWPEQTARIVMDGECVGWYLPPGAPVPDEEVLLDPAQAPAAATDVTVPGRVLERPWDLVAANAAQITRDFEAVTTPGAGAAGEPAVERIGFRPGMLSLGRDVTIEPAVVFDFSHGPIRLDDGVTVRAFTRLAGPAYVGARSTLLGGPYDAVSIGPVCRVHGEVEESVVLGYSNKAHDGFLGHAYLGRWVNLGAMTTNSDLKNNYGRIRMWTPDGETDTGQIKLGCLIGDHAKTGIGALLNTGTVIGAGSNLYGTAMPPKYVPPFSWGSGEELVAFDVEKFIALARTVMQRRDVMLSDGMERVLRAAWRAGRDDT